MASSRKPRSAEVPAAVRRALAGLGDQRLAVGLSGGVDSVVLLHCLSREEVSVRAIHVHHGLSPSADAWARFCRKLCKQLKVPLTVRRVTVSQTGKGLEAAAREARYAVFRKLPVDAIFLAHQLDDQAETVLMNLMRGSGLRGASGIPARRAFHGKTLLRPLLDVPREAIVAYARGHQLEWVEDESNAIEALTRNFIRRRIGPLLAERYPRWREALARAARHFSRAELDAQALLRAFLAERGLRAPSEAKLVEMIKQLSSRGARTLIEHEGVRFRLYRGKIALERSGERGFDPLTWKGERRLPLPALGGELRFRRMRGTGIDPKRVQQDRFIVKLRSGGERLQPDARRPRRTLKNLFQEAGVPPWQRERLPLLFCGDELVWVPGLGVDQRYQAEKSADGWLPQWCPRPP